MKIVVLTIVSLFSLIAFGQNSSCSDFKFGSYKIIMKGDSESYYTIERNESSQIETNDYGEKVYYVVKWLGDCSYVQKFDEKKMELSDDMKMINDDGGMVVELKKVLDENRVEFVSYVKKFKELSLTSGEFQRI
jgi:hypothetical protein